MIDHEIIDAHEVAKMLQVSYAWVIKYSNPKRPWHLPNAKMGKYRRYSRAAVLEALNKLQGGRQTAS
jgi:predicted DNA-binding transcriptional regulator AlpA